MTSLSVYFASRFDKIKILLDSGEEVCIGSQLRVLLRYRDLSTFNALIEKTAKKLANDARDQHFCWVKLENGQKEYVLSRFAVSLVEKELSPSKRKYLAGIETEEYYQELVSARLAGRREVQTPAGFIDVLTDKYIVEVKACSDWKHAIGQILVYSEYYPYHEKLLFFFGDYASKELINRHCKLLGISVRYASDPADSQWLLTHANYDITIDGLTEEQYQLIVLKAQKASLSPSDFLHKTISEGLGAIR